MFDSGVDVVLGLEVVSSSSSGEGDGDSILVLLLLFLDSGWSGVALVILFLSVELALEVVEDDE